MRSQEHELWVFDELFELLAPHGGNSTIDDAMIGAESHIHQGGDLVLVIISCGILIDKNALLSARHSQDACLWWINDGTEVVHTIHA